MKNISQFVYMSLLGSFALTSCVDNDKELGDPMDETITISSLEISNTEYNSSSDTICLLKNQQLNLEYSMYPDNVTNSNIKWSSSDISVVEVTEQGVLRSNDKAGIATIRLTPEIGFGPASVTPYRIVKVVNEYTYQESIGITNTLDEELPVGSEYQLKVVSYPYNATFKRYKWSSSDDNIATVSQHGVVKGVNKGSVLITVEADDMNPGSTPYSSAEFSVKTVTPIEDFSFIEDQELSALGYGQSYSIKYSLSPADATADLLEWSSDNSSVISVDNKGNLKVNSMTNGKAVITACYGNIARSVTVEVAEGRFCYSFADALSPWVLGNNATYVSDGNKSMVTMGASGSKFRGDLTLTSNNDGKTVVITPSTYRYLAVKFRPGSEIKPGSNSVGCVKFEMYDNPLTIGYNYKGELSNANNAFSLLGEESISTTSPNIIYYDLMSNFDNQNPTERSRFELVQMKFVMADYLEDARNYDLWWVRSFRTLEELESFVNSEN